MTAQSTVDPKSDAPGEIRVRVRYAECDPMGVAHHAVYPLWMEMARTEILRATGMTYASMEASGFLLVVTSLNIRFKASALYDDELLVRATVERVSQARIDHAYEISLASRTNPKQDLQTGALLATATTTLACVDVQGKPQRIPPELRAAK